MRLVGASLVRNESDIIEAFARTNLVLLDALHVMVHRSTDGTREILHALRAEGLPLTLSDIDEESFNQERHTTAATRAAFADGADFVFPLDADEFLRADSRAALEQSLASLPPGSVGAMRWLTYVPTGNDKPHANPLFRIEHRFNLSPSPTLDLDYCKVVVGAWFATRPGARIVEGNHAVFDGPQVATVPSRGVTVCHYPIRTGDQVAQKAALGWIAQLASGRPVEGTSVSGHWQRIFGVLKANGAVTSADITALASAYVPPTSRKNDLVVDPLPHRVESQRYDALARPRTFVQALIERTESLARNAGKPRGVAPPLC
jgi:hypothetical protein